jgi:hypothetical protein
VYLGLEGKIVLIAFLVVSCTIACNTPKKHIAIDMQLKNHPAVQQYINNPVYKPEFHDTDVLIQRKNLGKKYAAMYLLSHIKDTQAIDSLILFEIDNQNYNQKIVFPRTPSPLTPLMEAHYTKNTARVYANTTAEMVNYLYTNYAQKTWVFAPDTNLCDKKWKKYPLTQKIYVIKVQR